MAKGYDRREVTQDVNLPRTQAPQPDLLPLTPVQSPRPASFSALGDSPLANVLAGVTDVFGDYLKKKKEEQKLEGKLLYMQGKTELEVKEKGEAYHSGWMGMKVGTAADATFQQGLEDIQSKYSNMSPDQYRGEVLMPLMRDLTEQFGNSPEARQMTASVMEEFFPRLVVEQTKAYNAYNKQQTISAYGEKLLSSAQTIDPNDPEATIASVRELMTPGISGLPPEEERRVILDAAASEMERGSNIIDTLLTTEFPDYADATSAIPAGLEDAVLNTESGNRDFDSEGNTMQGPEVVRADGTVERAQGAMQVMPSTLSDPGYGITPAKDNTPAELRRVGKEYLAALSAKYDGDPMLIAMAYHGGPGKLNKYLSKIGDPRDGSITHAEFFAEYNGPNTKDYTEKVLSQMQVSSGTELTRRAAVQDGMQKQGFSLDELRKLSSTREKFLKDKVDSTELINAITNNAIGMLKPEGQRKALQTVQKQILADVAVPGKPEAQIAAEHQARYRQVLVDNNIVDADLKKAINLSMNPVNAVEKDGTINPRARDTFSTYLELRKLGGANYADQYLDDADTKRFMHNVLAYAEGTEADDDAFRRAAEVEARISRGEEIKVPLTDVVTIPVRISEEIKKLDYTWADRLLPKDFPLKDSNLATNVTRMTDEELTNAKNDPQLRMLIENRAMKLMEGGYSQKAAIAQAITHEMDRSAVILGNVVRSTSDKSIFDDAGATMFKGERNFFHAAVTDILKENGERHWGSAYAPFKITEGIRAGIDAWIRGVPDNKVVVQYNSDRKLFSINVLNREGTGYIGAPMMVYAEDVGAVGKRLFLEQRGATVKE